MIERTIYECEHCHKRRLINKYQMIKHEEKCYYNPNNKSCVICDNFNCEIGEDRGCEVHYDIHLKLRHGCPLWRHKEIKEGD